MTTRTRSLARTLSLPKTGRSFISRHGRYQIALGGGRTAKEGWLGVWPLSGWAAVIDDTAVGGQSGDALERNSFTVAGESNYCVTLDANYGLATSLLLRRLSYIQL